MTDASTPPGAPLSLIEHPTLQLLLPSCLKDVRVDVMIHGLGIQGSIAVDVANKDVTAD